MSRTSEYARQARKMARDVSKLDGWEVTMAANGHYRCKAPTGAVVCIAASPSRARTLLNDRARLRRAGADL